MGQLVDAQGIPQSGAEVALLVDQRTLGAARTDVNGNFAYRGVQGGVYQIAAANGTGVYRLWAPGTAPKGTPTTALLVT
ncbi:MAG: peptidase associated/transthyretin-like domain-containing protein, partial [Thermoguttaceae bacterium]